MKKTYLDSLNQSLKEILSKDDRVRILGEDILDPYGGAFKVTKGLSTEFPDKIIPTPISEQALTGIALGMSLRGLKPILEIMFGDFITLGTDQIINHISKLQAMYSQKMSLPLVIRTPMGGGRGYGPTHSQSIEKLYLGIPYVDVVAPSHFHDPGNLLKKSILSHKQPVIFIEHKLLYSKELIMENEPPLKISTHEGKSEYPTAIVKNYEENQHTPDIIVITYGGISRLLETVMKDFREEEIRILAYIPSFISSTSTSFIRDKNINECSNLLIVEEGTKGFDWGAEIKAQLHSEFGGYDISVSRHASDSTVIPAAMQLEGKVLPSVESIKNTIIGELV